MDNGGLAKAVLLGVCPDVLFLAFWYLNSPSLALRETLNCTHCWAKTGPRKRGMYERDKINRKRVDVIAKIHRTRKWDLAVIFTVLLNFLRGEQNVNYETRQTDLAPRRLFILECFELNRIALGNIYHKGISLCWQMGKRKKCVCVRYCWGGGSQDSYSTDIEDKKELCCFLVI